MTDDQKERLKCLRAASKALDDAQEALQGFWNVGGVEGRGEIGADLSRIAEAIALADRSNSKCRAVIRKLIEMQKHDN